jgi:hypothetical protein
MRRCAIGSNRDQGWHRSGAVAIKSKRVENLAVPHTIASHAGCYAIRRPNRSR